MRVILIKILMTVVVAAGIYLLWIIPKPADTPLGKKAVVQLEDGARIAYYHSGARGQTIVLLASLGRSVSDFNLLAPALNEAGFQTIAVDLRGVGASRFAPRQSKLTLFDYANDIEAALADDGASDNEPLIVIGHAFGNRVARAFATQNTDRVQAIVLIASGGSQKLEPGQRVSTALGNCFNWKMFPPKRVGEIRYAFFSGDNKIPASWKRGWRRPAARLQINATRTTPVAQWRDGGGVAPMLILQGKHDRIAPAALTSAKLKNDFPNRVQIITIDNAGHAILPEQPKTVADEILKFLLKR